MVPNTRHASTFFCDDIRYEVGYKNSIMGIYGADMLVDQIPTTYAKLCAVTFFETPIDQPVSNLSVKVYFNNKLVHENAITEEQLNSTESELQENDDLGEPHTVMTIGSNVILRNLYIEEPSIIKIVILADGEEYLAGKIRVKVNPKPSDTVV